MANWQDAPQVGQTVWCESHKNGVITGVDWESNLVYVNHYTYGFSIYEMDEFFGCFDERLNQWVIVPI